MNAHMENRLLAVVRAMAEDLLKLSYPKNKCPIHGVNTLIRDDNGIKHCNALGCDYEIVPGSEPTVSTIIDQYLERMDAN